MTYKVLDKVYDPSTVEDKWYTLWEAGKFFHADAGSEKPAFTIVIPPPNVTGMLTMGHILNNTIQDLLIRWKKMSGYETLWMPGTDHAGIATQNKVEQSLRNEGLTRYDLGREKFLERVWEWKEKYGGIILKQLRKLGAACDWDREAFTMSPQLSRAVREVFVSLYERGLIYRGRRLINWCPVCHTALADEEVENQEEEGGFWRIAYPLADFEGEIVVVTTRPETMLGDTAVAVHPEDERYKHLVGSSVWLPLMNRKIPIIADEHADPHVGSGAVKITPAHDFNDFEVGLRHHLEQINILNDDGTLNQHAGAYKGLDRFVARKKVLADLQAHGLLRQEEKKAISIPRCYRSHDVIEPYLSDQWFVKMKPLADPAIRAVRDGRIKFHPKDWEKTYYHWMENIRDWCISRQIWWGHRIPAWYCENDHTTVSREQPLVCSECKSTTLRQDEDVLDTWFSSWLWPFSTLGWPDETDDLKKFFPTDILATGPDIIFFWVARMIMAALEFMGDIPFSDVYFNGMIRDLNGRKMSKSLGNSPDPLWLFDGADKEELGDFIKDNKSAAHGIPAYGADAVRLTMLYMTPLGGDIRFDQSSCELGQKFANKLWNASRFVLLNIQENDQLLGIEEIDPQDLTLEDKWILSRLNKAIHVIDHALREFKLNDATHALYSFVWTEYCDWYVEMAKNRLYDQTNPRGQLIAKSIALYVLDNILRLLHPFMPFITEEIWHALPGDDTAQRTIMHEPYPQEDEKWQRSAVEREMILLQQVIGAIRNIRGEMNIPPAKEADVIVNSTDKEKLTVLQSNTLSIQKLARINKIIMNTQRPDVAASAVVQGLELFIPLADLIDIEVEKGRLDKEIDRLESQLAGLTKKLANDNFISRAPKEVVDRERQKKKDWETSLRKLKDNLYILVGK
ncbi:valine--tRNA ligase [candidate division KSB1 bacterium]|nr:valine--tRNA ligase [candidate division KSB1 bacterium]RQW05524.1 MAG: valine--tRNA ligase [candidate division KSB1 bacterium]